MFNATATASLSFTGMSYFLSLTTLCIEDITIVYGHWRVDHWWLRRPLSKTYVVIFATCENTTSCGQDVAKIT